jgi:hypothetical protein
MRRKAAPVILKGDRVAQEESEVLIRPPRGTTDGPRVLLRSDLEGRSVLDVTCPCGRRFDVVLEEGEEEES